MEHNTHPEVIKTNNDAANAKYISVIKGYYNDGFIRHFVPTSLKSQFTPLHHGTAHELPQLHTSHALPNAQKRHFSPIIGKSQKASFLSPQPHHFQQIRVPGPSQKKQLSSQAIPSSPLISRGYYSRVMALRTVIESFLNLSLDTPKRQFVSLGAGFDTTYWHYRSTGLFTDDHSYFELDLPEIVHPKIELINSTEDLQTPLGGSNKIQATKDELHTDHYHLMVGDLAKVSSITENLTKSGIQFEVPTMFISECVLIYLRSEDSDRVIKWIPEVFPRAMMWTYEQINPTDSFGAKMVENLNFRGCSLLGIHAYPELSSQIERYKKLQFAHCTGWNMHQVYNKMLDQKENTRLARIEIFDEIEEWKLIQEHYCLILASTFAFSTSKASIDTSVSSPKSNQMSISHNDNRSHDSNANNNNTTDNNNNSNNNNTTGNTYSSLQPNTPDFLAQLLFPSKQSH